MKYKNIVILADAGIGDFVWATSALSLIRQYDKNIEITLVTCDKYVELIDKNLKIDKIVTTNNKYHVSKNKFIRLFYKLFWSIKNIKYFYKKDICLILDISLFFTVVAKYLYRIKNIVGPNNFSFGYDIINKSAKYYSQQIIMPKNADKTSYMMRYQMLVRAIFPTYNLAIPILPNTNYLNKKILNLIGNTKKYKIAISPCGSVHWKRFNINNIKSLILKINKYNADVTFFIVGNSKKEMEYANTLINSLGNIDIRNVVGKTSLLELKELFSEMNLFITVDNGSSHIASTASIPVIAIYGTSFPENSGSISGKIVPLCSYRQCSPCAIETALNGFVCDNPKCIDDITPEIIFEKIKEILNKK